MENDGWKKLEEVWIPPIEKEGFQEDIIIRRPVVPMCKRVTKEAEPKAVSATVKSEPMADIAVPYKGEDATILLSDLEKYDGEDKTVLLNQEAALAAWLERVNTGEKVLIDKEEFVIGKSSSANYVIQDNVTISRRHAMIKKTEEGYYLEDMGSSNHTYIDGMMITEPVKLVSGTIFQLSREMFEFTIG